MTVALALPSGTVTFLFTDIERSTELWDRDRRGMAAAVARHDQLIRGVVDRFGGYIFTTAGDSFAVAFQRATAAVLAAVESQVQCRLEFDGGPVPLRIRMGLHIGECDERGGDYFGPAVTRAARVMGLARGGQVLVSRAVEELVAEELSDEVTFEALGEFALRGFSRQEEIFVVTAPGLREDVALPVGWSSRGNLPSPPTSFVGRSTDVREAKRRLRSTRLMTLVGPGGVGKTRLSIEVASAVAGEFPDGVWFVQLAPLSDGMSVAHTLATTLSVQADSEVPILGTIVRALAKRKVLIVLDNCEHVVESAAAAASQLVSETESVTVLASSREPLSVSGEWLWPVRPMSAADEASELFIQRARAVNPAFVLDEGDEELLAAMCAGLDGIPLAIELAAARCRSMTVVELFEGLGDRFQLLQGPRRRRRAARQQTLQAAVEWSYRLLDPEEQALFARLSVFAGGFTSRAVESVCVDDIIDRPDVPDLLDSLLSRSMLESDQSRGVTRFRLLETLRQFGRMRLAERGEASRLESRHVDFFAQLASEEAERLEGPGEVDAWREIDREWDNFRLAFERAQGAQRDDAAVRIVASLRGFGYYAQRHELFDWAHQLSERLDIRTSPFFPELCGALSVDLYRRGVDNKHAAELATEGLLSRPGRPEPFCVAVAGGTALTSAADADIATAELVAQVPPGEDMAALLALMHRCWYLALAKRVEEAGVVVRDLQALADRIGSCSAQSWVAYSRGQILAASDLTGALAAYRSAEDLVQPLSAFHNNADIARLGAATANARYGDVEQALRACFENLLQAIERGSSRYVAYALRSMSTVLGRLGDDELALELRALTDDVAHPGSHRRRPYEVQIERLSSLDSCARRTIVEVEKRLAEMSDRSSRARCYPS